MRAFLRTIAVVLVAIPGLVLFAEETPVEEIRPHVVITGASSCIEERAYVLVASKEKWLSLWFRHKGENPESAQHGLSVDAAGVPEIDFASCMVTAIFQGKSVNSAGLKAISVTVEKDKVVLRYDDDSYQTTGPPPNGGATPCSAYGFFVLPRYERTLVIEENICEQIGGAPVWQERTRLSPPLHQWLLAIRADQFKDKQLSPQAIADVIAALERLLCDKNTVGWRDDWANTRRIACQVLGRSGSKTAIPVLLKALEDPYQKVSFTGIEPGAAADMEWYAVWRDADHALREITGANPIDEPGQRDPIDGQREKILAAWVEWCRENTKATHAGSGQDQNER